MGSEPSESPNWPYITHLANCRNRNSPIDSSDESEIHARAVSATKHKPSKRAWRDWTHGETNVVAKNRTDLTNQRHINRARPPLGTLYVCIIQANRFSSATSVMRRIVGDTCSTCTTSPAEFTAQTSSFVWALCPKSKTTPPGGKDNPHCSETNWSPLADRRTARRAPSDERLDKNLNKSACSSQNLFPCRPARQVMSRLWMARLW